MFQLANSQNNGEHTEILLLKNDSYGLTLRYVVPYMSV